MTGRCLYLDLVGGASGDMLLAALVDAGAPFEAVRAAVAAMALPGVVLETEVAHPAGLRARRVHVRVAGRVEGAADAHQHPAHAHDHPHEHEQDHAHEHAHGEHRPYALIRDRVAGAALEPRARAIALEAFRRLAEAEGKVHGVDPEAVEFHEVGSDDAIADIVGVAAAVVALGVGEVVASPVPLGRGLARSAHGVIPAPGPATLELLAGVPVEGVEVRGETITPTGAALLRAITTRFGRAPAMTLEAVGVGAGQRSWPDRPNVIRALVGRAHAPAARTDDECVVETNLDDMNPEHLAPLRRALLDAGALDVWSTPIAMKKDRAGTLVAALARRTLADAVAAAFFVHSTTLGVRIVEIARVRSERRVETVATAYGPVRVKIAPRPAGPPVVAPEHDDCEGLALRAGVPIRAVAEAAMRAAWARMGEV